MVLASGGIDSSACISYYMDRAYRVEGLFVDYGQAAALNEKRAIGAVGTHYGIVVRELKLSHCHTWGTGCIPGRNAFLLFTGMMNFEHPSGIIAIGVHAGTHYWDCSPEFVAVMQTCFDQYTDGRIQIDAPFLHMDKRQIWNYCVGAGVPLEATYSCEAGTDDPCGQCDSCKDVERLHAQCFDKRLGAKPHD